MNKEYVFDSFRGIETIIVSDIARAVSYLHSRDIVYDIKPGHVLVSNSHYKSYKHKELEMASGKKPIVCIYHFMYLFITLLNVDTLK